MVSSNRPTNESIENHFLSTVAIIRYQAKKDRRASFAQLYPRFKQELAECKRAGVDLSGRSFDDIEEYHESMFIKNVQHPTM